MLTELRNLTVPGMTVAIALTGLSLTGLSLTGLPAAAQTCAPLRVVKGAGYQVQKTVSVPGAGLIARNNWNTDFSVPRNPAYRTYQASIIPKNDGVYSVQMNLKYPNDSTDKVFSEKVSLKQGRAFTIRGSSRIDSIPHQVNLSVGGVEVVGNSYTASVSACR